MVYGILSSSRMMETFHGLGPVTVLWSVLCLVFVSHDFDLLWL